MSFRVLFRFSMYLVRFLQIAALVFTTYTICCSAWSRRAESNKSDSGPEYSDIFTIITCAALGAEILLNSDVHQGSDPRLSVIGLGLYTIGLCVYMATPEIKQYLKLASAELRHRYQPECSAFAVLLNWASVQSGVITWAITVVYVLFSLVEFVERARSLERYDIDDAAENTRPAAAATEPKLGILIPV